MTLSNHKFRSLMVISPTMSMHQIDCNVIVDVSRLQRWLQQLQIHLAPNRSISAQNIRIKTSKGNICHTSWQSTPAVRVHPLESSLSVCPNNGQRQFQLTRYSSNRTWDAQREKGMSWHSCSSCRVANLPEARMAGVTVEETAFEDVNMWQAPVSQKPPLMGT